MSATLQRREAQRVSAGSPMFRGRELCREVSVQHSQAAANKQRNRNYDKHVRETRLAHRKHRERVRFEREKRKCRSKSAEGSRDITQDFKARRKDDEERSDSGRNRGRN